MNFHLIETYNYRVPIKNRTQQFTLITFMLVSFTLPYTEPKPFAYKWEVEGKPELYA